MAAESHGGEKMGVQTKSRDGWMLVLVLIGGMAWVLPGCNPQMLYMLLAPMSDNNIQPEHKLFAKDKEITLALLVNFAPSERSQYSPDIQAAPAELAELTKDAFRKRCEENKHKLKIIPDAQVRSEEARQRQMTGGYVSPVELGKGLKADFVLDLTISSFSLYAKNPSPPMYRGKADLAITLFRMNTKADESHKAFFKDFTRLYPRDDPIDASSTAPPAFRRSFLLKVANEVTKTFI